MALHDLDVPVIANVYVLSPGAARVFHAGGSREWSSPTSCSSSSRGRRRAPTRAAAFFLDLAAQAGRDRTGARLPRRVPRRASEARGLRPDPRHRARPSAPTTGGSSPASSSSPTRTSSTTSSVTRRPGSPRPRSTAPISPRRARRRSATQGSRTGSAAACTVPSSSPARWHSARAGSSPARSSARRGRSAGSPTASSTRPRPCCSRAVTAATARSPRSAYLCPESQCVKNQRNGPCGGTRQGLCEIGEKECIWVRAYERLKAYGEEETMLDGPAVIKNAASRARAPGATPTSDATITPHSIRPRRPPTRRRSAKREPPGGP